MLLDNNMTEGTNCMCDLFFCAKSGQKPWGGGGRAKRQKFQETHTKSKICTV